MSFYICGFTASLPFPSPSFRLHLYLLYYRGVRHTFSNLSLLASLHYILFLLSLSNTGRYHSTTRGTQLRSNTQRGLYRELYAVEANVLSSILE